jgi:capsular polysaccharide biosynthesis protein
LITSEPVLLGVVKDLDLGTTWAQRYSGDRLTPTNILQILRQSISPSYIRGTKYFRITVYDTDAHEAAAIANALAGTYRDYRNQHGSALVEVMETAAPAIRPTRPNKPKWIAIGVLAGLVFGALVGSAAAWLAIGVRTAGGAELKLVLTPSKDERGGTRVETSKPDQG